MNTMFSNVCLVVGLTLAPILASAQEPVEREQPVISEVTAEDTLFADSARIMGTFSTYPDSISTTLSESLPPDHQSDRFTWRPSPKRALWLALVMPGAGQIYNRKYWKLPIFYGGFVGCAYAMRWNNMMYRDYSQAYLDIMDDDPTTQSFNQFLHLGNKITPENAERWKDIFRKRKDRYRRWRDLGFFVLVGVYALSVIDAYVDASLSEFDISPDLSMRVSPVLFEMQERNSHSKGLAAFGLQCSLNF